MIPSDRLSTHTGRVAEQDWLLPRIREEARKYPSDALQAKLTEAGIPNGPVRRPDELATDKHLLATGQLMAVEVPRELGYSEQEIAALTC